MEVDERLRWLEARISSSLRPRADELRSLFSDEENRHAFLAFCNHSESRRLFIHLPEAGEGNIRVSPQPPRELSEKALFFLKCSHASKLSRESIAQDVVYSECSRLPLEHLELVMREVYLPLMVLQPHGVSGDKLLDLLHRLVGSLQVTRGFSEGKVVLPLPSIEVLAEAASSADRRTAVIHVLESCVVAWMKQVKIALHFDPKTAILKAHGKYAGPLAEVEFWSSRLSRLESVRGQLSSVVVLSILHNLQQAHSTYAQAFLHVHRDIGRAIADTEHCLVYLTALRPWLQRLSLAYSPETLVKIFPPLMATLMLVWQHSGLYSVPAHLHRLLRLLANEVAGKARDIVGESPLQAPDESLLNIKLALRVCAAFRGCYLDYRERGEGLLRAQHERKEGLVQQIEEQDSTHPLQPSQASHQHPASTWCSTGGPTPSHTLQELCPWPPRNSPVFSSLNGVMERCNDLLELVQTVMDFKELEIATYGVGVADAAAAEVGGAAPTDPLVADICTEFAVCLQTFEESSKDLLSLEPDCPFEEGFFQLRSTVRSLEQRLGVALLRMFELCPSLAAELRLLECFQGVCQREAVKDCLQDRYQGVVSKMLAEVQAVCHTLSENIDRPPSHTNVPPMASKLLWLHALRVRVSGPMEQLREVAPQLLDGDLGWKLRQEYAELSKSIQSYISETEGVWSQSVSPGLTQRLKDCVLTRSPEGQLVVNFDPTLREVLQEIRYMTRPPLSVALPPAAQQLLKGVEGVELGVRITSLGVVVQAYNELWAGLSEVDQLLFHHKLQQVDNLLAQGLESLDWSSAAFPDFVAKARALVCGDLQAALQGVHQHTAAIRATAGSWSLLPGLDIFQGEGGATLEELQDRHSVVLESLEHTLPPAAKRISSHLQAVFQNVDASQASPAWGAYLTLVDDLALDGLRAMVLTAISTLITRAHRYEQGDQIPPLVTVQLELQGEEVQFSPPLSTHSALPSIPEVVQHWMDSYTNVARLARRFSPGQSENCYTALREDPEIRSAIAKVSAHLETNARQCQSVRNRFSIYAFLWEQDVGTTFDSFLRGQAPPHPRRFTRPETVRSRASARALSAKSSSQSQQQLAAPAPETTLLGVMGVSDWDFLRPPGSAPSQEEEDTSRRPSLDDFDGEIAVFQVMPTRELVFQGVLERLSNVEGVANVGWLRVDQRPAKQALSSLAAKWKHTFTSYLERQIQHVLGCLEQFFCETEPEVEGISGDESGTQAFMHFMAVFNKVNTQQVEMDTKFGALHRAMLMLDKFGHPLSPTIKEQFSTAPHRWSNLKKRVSLGKQRIGPRIQASGELISRDLLQFGTSFTTLHEEFQASRCLHHECSRGEALEAVGVFRRRLGTLQVQARDLIELQELLETSVFNFAALNEFEDELTALQEVWTIAESVLYEHGQWRSLYWYDVKTAELMMATDRQLEPVSALPPLCHGWDVFQHLCNTIQEVQTTLPLVEGLRGPAMRPRHWKQVLHYAPGNHSLLLGRGGAFDPTHLQEMTFGELLELGLYAHSLEVLAVVERAERDVAIEALLKTLEEVWLSRQLELCSYQRAAGLGRQEAISELGLQDQSPRHRSPSARVKSALRRGPSTGRVSVLSAAGTPGGETSVILLLCNTKGIFETLESHQMSLQSQFGTAAATAFSDDLTHWHKQLQTVEAVLRAWLEVQQLWVGLEEVYGSPEVQAHLPGPTFTFSSVDQELRELTMRTTRNPAVMPTCLKEGLLPSLEKMQTGLLQCQSALLQYMEGKRQHWPWFYLLPSEDILLFICCGSNPGHISSHISKLLPHAASLVVDHALHAGGGNSRIMRVVSILGEQLELNQPVHCEGAVESILQNLMTSLSATLQNQLVSVVTKHILKNGVPSLSDLPAIWSSSMATQVTILATELALELSTEQALKESGKGVTNALGELSKEVVGLMATVAELLQGTASDRIADAARTVSALTALQSESQLLPDSNEAPEASLTDMQAEGRNSRRVGVAWRTPISREQANKLQAVLMVLSSFRLKAGLLTNQLASSDGDPTCSFAWESMLHFQWSSREQHCVLSSLQASLPYGYHYSGSSTRLVATPTTECCLVHLLQTFGNGAGSLLAGPECSGKSSLVQELATSAGQPLFSLHCSPLTHHTTLSNCIRGMVATGCWLFLHHVSQLPPAVLQSACSLLLALRQARMTGAQTVDWPCGAIRVNLDKPGACFASVVPRSCEGALPEALPHSLLEAFRPCHAPRPQLQPILEALFLAHDFEGGAHLGKLLATFCTTAKDLLNQNPICAVQGNEGVMPRPSPSLPLGLPLLKAVISQAQRHLGEFDALGLLQGGGALQMASGVQSEFSESTKASLKFSSMVMRGVGSERPTQRQSLEEFAVVLALKDCLLPTLPPAGPEHTTTIQLIGDIFPRCDLTGLLSHEGEVREGLAEQALVDRAAMESARESRATSAMQMVAEVQQPSEVGGSLENHIVHCCLLHQLSPTPSFQLATAHLHALLQPHPLVAIAGPSGSGKSSCIKVTAEVLRELGEVISCVTLASGAMREEQLFGYLSREEGLWQEGLLPKLLARLNSTGSARPASRWLIIDGRLSPTQLDTLVSYLTPDSSIKLSNGKTIQLNQSYRFILEMPDLSILTPSTANKIGKLCMSPAGVTWREVVHKWLSTHRDREQDLWLLFEKYVPKCLDFLVPVVTRPTSEGAGPAGLETQSLQLSEVHLAGTLCNILQSQLPVTMEELAPEALERNFSYAVVWTFGGFLATKNRTVFESWWRGVFGQSRELAIPGGGTLWDYYLDPQTNSFVHFSEAVPHYSPPGNLQEAPFVPTVQSMAVSHLIRMLIDRDCPVLLNGTTGSGKTATLLQLLKSYCVQGVTEAGLLHIYTSRSTGAEGVWSQLQGALEWRWGRNHTPKGCRRLVCFIDDLHNAQPPSEPPSPSVSELVRHHLAAGGVHDPASGKWHSISDVCYVCTSHASPGRGLDPRFLKHFTTLHWEDYDSDTLFHIFSSILRSHFCPTNQSPSPVRSSQSVSSMDPAVLQALVQAAVQVHEKVQAMFLPTPERLHYVFSLRHIAAIFRRLCLGLGRSSSSHDLLLLWQQESWWTYAGALSSKVDRERYWEAVCHAVRKFFGPEELPLLLSDKSCHLPQEAAAALRVQLAHHVSEHNTTNPTLHVPLYESTVEEAWYLSHTLTSPPDQGHTLLLGHTHPDTLVHLAALHAGFTVVQPSHLFSPGLLASEDLRGMAGGSYGVEQLTRDLRAVYTSAGVKGERLLLLLTQTELFHESFLDCLYHFVKDAAISHLFPLEERSHIVSAIRSELSQAGLAFCTETAWAFFVDRVRTNLRVVVAMPQMGVAMPSGCAGWAELLNALKVCYHLPWDRKQLMNVAMHHLAAQPSMSPSTRENVAHLLGSVLLRLRASSLLHSSCSNHSYQYFAERFVHELFRSQAAGKEKREQLAAALECVRGAEGRRDWLEERLGREKEVLLEKAEGCSKLLTQIGQDTAISKEHSKLVSRQRTRISHLHRVIPDYEHALGLAKEEKKAIVEGLHSMVAKLEPESLQELRGLLRPPRPVEELLAAVIIVVKSPSADTSWTKGAKRLMANLDRFRELLLEYSGREWGSEVILEALDPLLANPDLSPEQLEQGPGGLATAQLCRWVNGIVRLHTTLQTRLRPLQERVESMNNSLKECSEKLAVQEAKVEDLQRRLDGLCSTLESASVERSRQQEAVNSMAKELQETHDFINALAGVHDHWEEELPSSNHVFTHAVGELAVAMALTVFLGPSPPHSQWHTLTQHLTPLLEERGVGLHWRPANNLIRVVCLPNSQQTTADHSAVNDSMGESPIHDPAEPLATPTYAHLCSSLLPLLMPEEFLDQWLARGYSLPELQRVGGVASAWNRWPLIYDPEGFAASWLQEYRGAELVELDATERSSEFFHALEQALLHGRLVLVKGVASTLDPALQPLVELGHTWHSDTGPKVIRFCGRKLHVHPSFHLYLSTTSPPHTLPPALLTSTAVVDFSASPPLVSELLLKSAFQLLHAGTGWGEAASHAAECQQKLAKVEGELLSSLGDQNGRQDGYWWGTERVSRLMATRRELETELGGHMDHLRQLSATKFLLLPLAQHSTLLWGLLRRLGGSRTSWEEFSGAFCTAVDHTHHQRPQLWPAITASEEGRRESDSAVRELQKAIDQAVLQDAVRYLSHDQQLQLATALALLSHSDPWSDPILSREQLLFLSEGEDHLRRVDVGDGPPAPPSHVSEELWLRLHKLPLSTRYLSQVVASTHTAPQFWAGLEPGTEEEAKKVDGTALPWRQDGNPVTLEDLVLLSSLHGEAALRALQEEARGLVRGTSLPLLADTVQGCKGKPLLILYDERDVASSVKLWHLEAEIRRALQGKSVRVMCLGAGVEGRVGEVLVQPTCDCLLVTDIQRAGQWEEPEWLRLLLWRTKKALNTGCQVVLTASVHAPLPPDLLHASRILLLSSTTSLTSTLPSAMRKGEKRGFLPALCLVLAGIPEEILTSCASLPEQLQAVSFCLAVLHTAVALNGSEGGRSTWCGVPPYDFLLAAISHALSLAKTSPKPPSVPQTLSSLQHYVTELYSLWMSEGALEELTSACLSQEGMAPGGILRLGGAATQISVPPSMVEPRCYADHVAGLVQAEQDPPAVSPNHLTETIEELLLPVLATLPGSEHTLSSDRTPSDATKVCERLEWVLEHLPSPLPLSGASPETPPKGGAWTSLPSAHRYQAFLFNKAISQFNSTLSTIRREAEDLLQLAAVDFDSLPSFLAPVLSSVRRGELPCHWIPAQPGTPPQTLQEGVEDLHQTHSVLQRLLNK